MTRRLLPTSLAVLAFAAGCGGPGGDPDADPAAVVPARAPVYVEAVINPEGDTADNVRALSEKLAGTGDPGGEIIKLLERQARLSGDAVDYSKDIDPWLGNRLGLFLTSINAQGREADAAVVAPVEDTEKAEQFLEKELKTKGKDDEQTPKLADRKHRDVTYRLDTANAEAYVVLDEYAVFGTEAGVKGAIDAQEGEPLADADAFKKARDQVAEDNVGFGYLKLSTLFSSLGPQGAAARQVLGGLGETVAFALDADADAIRLETASLGVEEGGASGPGSVVEQLPGDAWLAVGTADLGGRLERSLRQIGQLGAFGGFDLEEVLGQVRSETGIDVRKDLIAWLGDAGLFVGGGSLSRLSGALVVRSKDAAKTAEVVPEIARYVRRQGVRVTSLRRDGVDAGFTARVPGMPLPIHVAAAGDRFIVAVTDAALDGALRPAQPLSESHAYKDAAGKLDDGIKPALFLDFEPIRALVDESGSVQGAEAERGRRALDHLTTLAAGSRRDGDVVQGRLVVGVK
jgi:hypothetical protein